MSFEVAAVKVFISPATRKPFRSCIFGSSRWIAGTSLLDAMLNLPFPSLRIHLTSPRQQPQSFAARCPQADCSQICKFPALSPWNESTDLVMLFELLRSAPAPPDTARIGLRHRHISAQAAAKP